MFGWVTLSALCAPAMVWASTPFQWGDLEGRIGSAIELRQKVRFDAENITILPGRRFHLTEFNSLGGIPVYYVEAKALDCPSPEQKAEMILVTPEAPFSGADPSVGVELDLGCTLKIYFDTADYFSTSLFQDPSG